MSIGLLLFIIATIAVLIGLYGMFKKAGITPWKALIPLYNTWWMVDKMKLEKDMVFSSAYSYRRAVYYHLDQHKIC